MALDHINIDATQSAAKEANELLTWIRTLRQAYELGVRIRAKMGHNFTANANEELIDWSQVQTLWGITSSGTNTGTASNGKAVFTYVDGATGAMEGAFQNNACKEVTERVG